MNELISVIVPVYNVEEFLPECVESILGQSYEHLELILVDDGSTDSSGSLCDSYGKKDERVRVIHKKNGGLSSARNAGLDICSGSYVFFVDSDDHIYEKTLERLYGIMKENDCDIVQCGFCDTADKLGTKQREGKLLFYTGREMLDSFYGAMHNPITIAWNKLYRRSIIGNSRFPEGYIHEDEATVCRFLYNAKKVGWIKENLYRYRSRKGSITGSDFSLKRLDILKAYEYRIDFYKNAGETEYLSREEQFHLSAILDNYGKIKRELPKERTVAKDLIKLYREKYKNYRKTGWNISRRLSCFIFFFFPGMYSILKRRKQG